MTNRPALAPASPDTLDEPSLTELPTQPMPPTVVRVRRLLTAVLESGPSLEDTLTVTEALDLLLDVDPPYPPLGLEDDPLEPEAGVAAALLALDHAAETAATVREITRYAVVALTLQTIQPASGDPS